MMSKKVVIDPKIKDDLIWASGHFLCESFPGNFDKWTDKKLNKFIENNPWEPFQYLSLIHISEPTRPY